MGSWPVCAGLVNLQNACTRGTWTVKKSSRIQTAILAVGGSLAAAQSSALELGDVRVHSALGQPLRASIAYALAPNEAISDSCVSLMSAPSSSGLPTLSGGSMIVADGVIAIMGNAIVNEPLVSMRVNINCPYTPRLTREYMLFVDPADVAPQPMVTRQTVTESSVPESTNVAAPSRPAAARPSAASDPVGVASRYQVQPGDTLSEIAQRIQNRPVGLWPAVNAIFAANPDAFLDNDVNRLKAGAWLDIPDFGTGTAMTVASANEVVTESAGTADSSASSTVYDPEAVIGSTVSNTAAGAGLEAPVADAGVVEAAGSDVTTLRPGDVVTDQNNPFVNTVSDENVVIPDTLIDAPAVTSSSPNAPVAIIQRPQAEEESTTNWILWFLGGALAIVAGLFGFRLLRPRFGSTATGGARSAIPQRRRSDGDTQRIEAIGAVDAELPAETGYAQESFALDADLEIGSGLSAGEDVEVSHDFAFASTTALDIELPEEMSSGDTTSNTDIIPPLNIDPDSILENEVLPGAEDDDYDMSVIIDATQMPDPTDITERDLEAIEVEDADETLITNDYTVSQEVDYSILEKDYEDELTATQRLNAEIQKAAEDLAKDLGDEDDTGEISMATVHELDLTAQMRGRNDDDIADDDDTGVNPTVSLEPNDKTAEMPVDDRTAEMQLDDMTTEMRLNDITAEMPADDLTVEMQEDHTAEMPLRKGKKRAG